MSESEQTFQTQADAYLRALQLRLDAFDPDELEADLSSGVLKITFADKRSCVLNRQSAARQIWMAEGASAWHFLPDESGQWNDTKGRGPLGAILAEVVSKRLGRPVTL